MEKTFNLLILGEAGSGKSDLVQKFLDPNYEVKVSDETEDYFWGSQLPTHTLTKPIPINGGKDTVTLLITEVQGSKGRSSNYYEISEASSSADCVLYCFDPARSWTMQGYTRTMELVQQGRQSALGNAKNQKNKNKKKKANKANKANNTLANGAILPSYLIRTKGDREVTDESEAFAKTNNVSLFHTSALKNENVTETFAAIAQDMFDREVNNERERKLKLEQEEEEKKKNLEKEAQEKKKVDNKKEMANLFRKFMKLLGKSEANKNPTESEVAAA